MIVLHAYGRAALAARRSAACRYSVALLLDLLQRAPVFVLLILPLAQGGADLVPAEPRAERVFVAANHLVERIGCCGLLRRRRCGCRRRRGLGKGGRGSEERQSERPKLKHDNAPCMWTDPYTPDAQDPPVVPSLLRARNIEGDRQALAFAEWPCAVPHVGREQHQPPR